MRTAGDHGRSIEIVDRDPSRAGLRIPLIGWILVALALAAVLVLAVPHIDLPFGHSNDGFNGAVWGEGTRALREDGVLTSRFGGVRGDGTAYANHPPLLVVATGAAEAVLGEHRWVDRAVPLAATLAALVLLYVLCRTLAYSSTASGIAVAAVAVTPMVLGFGSMLDTPVTSLPFGVALLILWQRRRLGDPLPSWVEGSLALFACIAGWQSALLALAIAVVIGFRHRRAAVPVAVGAGVGLVLAFGWPLWVYGGAGQLMDQFVHRTGADGSASLMGSMEFQAAQVRALLGIAVVGFVGVVAALRRPSVRPVAAASLLVVVSYVVIFHQGATHDYWAFWAVLPAAIGIAELSTLAATSEIARRPVVSALLLVALGAGLLVDARLPSPVDQTIAGAVPAQLLKAASWPRDQDTLVVVGAIADADAWLEYETRADVVHVDSVDELRARAANRPEDVVLLIGSCDGGPSGDLCRTIWRSSGSPQDFETTDLAEAAARARGQQSD